MQMKDHLLMLSYKGRRKYTALTKRLVNILKVREGIIEYENKRNTHN